MNYTSAKLLLSVREIRSRSYLIIYKYRFVFFITAISAVPDQHLSLKRIVALYSVGH